MRKALLLILSVFSAVCDLSAQEWKTKSIEADELTGAKSGMTYCFDADDCLVVVSESDIAILSKTGVFDYVGADNHVMVTVGLYDSNSNLNEKLRFMGFVSPKQPDMVFLRDYRMKVLNARHPDNFIVTRIRNYILNSEGSVRFVIPLFHTSDLDVKLPTVIPTQIRQ